MNYFTDAVLRGPTIGCMLMCLGAALVGSIVFLRKQSLIGESLSHAAYPGVNIGVFFSALLLFDDQQEVSVTIFIMIGAFLTALIGLWTIDLLQKKLNVRSDSAMCFVLSSFFGIGLTISSRIQFTYPALYRKIQVYLFGQAATMTDTHILVYAVLSLIILIVIILLYKEIKAITFDPNFAKSIGINAAPIDTILFILIVLAVVIGIRSVGVVLMSAMLIAPAVAARQYTNKFSKMLILAAFFGLLSGYLGNYFSVEFTHYLMKLYPSARITLSTGPMIVVVASCICLLSLLFAPEKGMLVRFLRIVRFRYRCVCENLLKAIWRFDSQGEVIFEQILKYQSSSPLYLRFILWRLVKSGWLDRNTQNDSYQLTGDGQQWAAKIVRLHRLWEVYLADYLGVGAERVHRNAEEMEHIITPELEQELTLLLKDPKEDPHNQPIPPKEA